MGLTSSDYLEELLHKCYELGIMDEVRDVAINLFKEQPTKTQYEIYEIAYEKVTKKKF